MEYSIFLFCVSQGKQVATFIESIWGREELKPLMLARIYLDALYFLCSHTGLLMLKDKPYGFGDLTNWI